MILPLWAAACAERVLHLFESAQPSDPRPREAIEQIRAWARVSSANSSRTWFANSSWRISACETRSAGRSSTG